MFAPIVIPGSAAATPHSLHFSGADSTYLQRTFTAGDPKKWTFATFIKPNGTVSNYLFSAATSGSVDADIRLLSNQIYVSRYDGGYVWKFLTVAALTPSAVSHLVVAVDMDQAAQEDRVKIWINGVLQAVTGGGWLVYPPLGYAGGLTNTAIVHRICSHAAAPNATCLNCWLDETYFIGGAQLDPSAFATFPGGVPTAATYAGSYAGANSCYLSYDDNSSTAALGSDSSGYARAWALSNITTADSSGALA